MIKFYVDSILLMGLLFSFSVVSALASPIYFDLVSPQNCTLRSGKLENCQIPAIEIPTSGQRFFGIPLKSTFKVACNGDCCSPYPLSLDIFQRIEGVVQPNVLAVGLLILQDSQTEIRAADHGPLGMIEIRDKSHWTKLASLPASCRSQLEVNLDIADINSKNEALYHIRQLVGLLQRENESRIGLRELLSYRTLFQLFRDLASEFHQQLGNDTLASIRLHSQEYLDLLEMIRDSDQLNLTRPSRRSMDRLQNFIEEVAASQNSERRELVNYLGEADRELLERLGGNVDHGARHQQQLEAFTQRIAQQCHELDGARRLLNAWLIDQDWAEFQQILEVCQNAQ